VDINILIFLNYNYSVVYYEHGICIINRLTSGINFSHILYVSPISPNFLRNPDFQHEFNFNLIKHLAASKTNILVHFKYPRK